MSRILIIFIICLFNSNLVNALSVEDYKLNGSEYQIIKDWDNNTLKYKKRFNSLIRDVSNNFIFMEKHSVINLNIKYFYSLKTKTKPKLFLDGKEWNNFSYQLRENGKSKKDYDHRISFNHNEIKKFISSKKLEIKFENFEAELDLTILPLDQVSILDKNKNNSSKKTTTIIDDKKVNKINENKNTETSKEKKNVVSKNNSSKKESLNNLTGGKNKQIKSLKQIEGINDASWPQDISLWIVMENPNAGHDFKKLGSMVCNGSVTNFGIQKGYTITFWNLYTKKQIEKYRCY